MFAGNHALDNLCLIVDHNGLQIDGTIEEVNSAMPIADKFRAFKFHVIEVADGNDFDSAARRLCRGPRRPTACLRASCAKPPRAKASPSWRVRLAGTGKAPNDEQYAQAMAELDAHDKEGE